ncbi:hypothetical protein [Amnibacterium sp.]|uniref:hypothetical protein n=1 Tax=Amnibacterium sp. TaxID=1872496 RepID=UPI0026227A25|nr:hypothetical protein [Amnibacterium sp.]MCU1475146.1 hypothetical protein [Amnibacterium sp.]
MTTPARMSATDPISPDRPDQDAGAAATGEGTHRDDVSDSLPLPNDPVDATGLFTADDLNGEAPD